jgi:hypothetical protein
MTTLFILDATFYVVSSTRDLLEINKRIRDILALYILLLSILTAYIGVEAR